jgi:hypothetical protein
MKPCAVSLRSEGSSAVFKRASIINHRVCAEAVISDVELSLHISDPAKQSVHMVTADLEPGENDRLSNEKPLTLWQSKYMNIP